MYGFKAVHYFRKPNSNCTFHAEWLYMQSETLNYFAVCQKYFKALAVVNIRLPKMGKLFNNLVNVAWFRHLSKYGIVGKNK